MDPRPGSEPPKGLKAFLDSLSPVQQGAIVLGGLALLALIAMPFIFGGVNIPGLSPRAGSASAVKKAAEGELFARKDDGSAPRADAGGAAAPASSPAPNPGEVLGRAVGGTGSALEPGGSMPRGSSSRGGGGPIGAQGEVNMGGGRPGGMGPSGTIGGYTTDAQAARTASGRALGAAAEGAARATGAGSTAQEGGSGAPETKPGGQAIGKPVDGPGGPQAAENEGGAGVSLAGLNPFASGGVGGDEGDDDCAPSVAARYDGRIEAHIKNYIALVEERRDAGCRGITCGMYNHYCHHHDGEVRARYAHYCRCDQLACRQQSYCAQGHELNCQRDRACGNHAPENCSNRKCDLDPY